MLHLIGHLSPVVHHKYHDLYRVPVRRVGDAYIVYVADGYHRIYDESTLPSVLKSKLTMLLARGSDAALFTPEHRLQSMTVYTNRQSEELDEIGWRVSETYYCLVMDLDTLEQLRGSCDDTRKKS